MYLDCVKIFQGAKLQAFVKMQITCKKPKTFQNGRIFRELNNVTLAELPSKLIAQKLVLTCLLRVESLHTLFVCSIRRSISVSTDTSNKQILSRKSETCEASPVARAGLKGRVPGAIFTGGPL